MKLTGPNHDVCAIFFRCGLLVAFLTLTTCRQDLETNSSAPTSIIAHATAIIPSATATVPTTAQEPPSLPLSEPGPYAMSKRIYVFEDASRDNRKVSFTVWYPAVRPVGAEEKSRAITMEHDPDLSGAPYPLLISSTEMANTLAKYVVSHGFTWVSVNGIHSYAKMSEEMYSQPLDILFGLDRAAAHAFEDLQDVINAEHTGVIGYSFDGYNTLALSGARIDPQCYLENCTNPDTITAEIKMELSAFSCTPAHDWDAFTANAGKVATMSEDGLWQPMTDSRIRAVMPMAGEGWWLFGERGLAAVEKPTLILVATQDELYPENVLIYKHLGSHEKTFISFVDLNHMMIFRSESIARIAHFSIAFFSYHLQGREDYKQYFSEDFVGQFNDLAWGVHKDE